MLDIVLCYCSHNEVVRGSIMIAGCNVRLKWQRLSKSCHLLFKIEWLCMSSAPVVLHAGLNDKSLFMQQNRQLCPR